MNKQNGSHLKTLPTTRTENLANGTAPVANGTSMVVNNGISSSKNGHVPYSSSLDGAMGGKKHGEIFNTASGGKDKYDEKVHIYNHHENRPVSWPPKPPPGVRLSFRESKSDKEQ